MAEVQVINAYPPSMLKFILHLKGLLMC